MWPTLVAVKVMMCWTSLQVRQGRTCNIRATMPAARGAAADVPVWLSVQPVPICMDQSDVTCRHRERIKYDLQIEAQYKECQVSHSSGRKPNTNAHIGKCTYPDEGVQTSHSAKLNCSSLEA